MSSPDKMFAPNSIAVIGASRRQGTLGKMFLDAISSYRFCGKIFPVNPKADVINDIKCYPDIASLPETPDLAVILISKDYVLETIDALGTAGIKNIIVISAGFRETGETGRILEENLLNRIRKYGMRMIGPNSMGLFNTATDVSLNATFSPTPPIPGHVAFISQSGALGVAVLELAIKMHLGFSLFVSTGNKTDIGDFEVLKYAAGDKNTRVIAIYEESIDNPSDFRRLAQSVVAEKPILVLKAGRTDSGLRAASSHTGALVSNDVLTGAFFRQCGVLRCDTLQELLHTSYALSTQPHPAGNRVAVITNAGGPGILASDALERAGLALCEIQPDTLSEIKKILPAEAGIKNPFDMIASADHDTYCAVFNLLEKDSGVDILMVIVVKPPVDTTPRKIISTLAPFIDQSAKPVYFVLMADTNEEAGLDIFQDLRLPVVPYPELAAQVIGNHYQYTQLRKTNKNLFADIIRPHQDSIKKKQAGLPEIVNRLESHHISLSPYRVIRVPSEGIDFLNDHGPVALKVADERFIHKSDQGLLHLNIHTIEDLNKAFSDLEQKIRLLTGTNSQPEMLIQQMISNGIELILGSKTDPVLGPVIMFGIGGIFVELYRDVTFRVLPIDIADVYEMLDSVKGRALLNGFRNLPPVDRTVLAKTIFNFSELIGSYDDIIEMDLNPVIWSFDHQKPMVVDARMTIKE